MNQEITPYLDALTKYIKNNTLSFHTPGHKQGMGAHTKIKSAFGENIFLYDLDVDDIEDYDKVLEAAEDLAREVFNADRTFFLVNGSTVGIQAMILATCTEKDSLLLPRNTHKSVLSGIILCGVKPIFILPKINTSLFIPHNISPEVVKTYIEEHKDIKAVVAIHPTYHGLTTDIEAIVRICHDSDKLLLVDEAWGAHFGFSGELPPSAMSAGADMSVNSSHKLLSSMTQSSMLHIKKNNNLDLDNSVRFFLDLLQTSSPSCILRASLDCTRMQMATQGKKLLNKVIELSKKAREEINKIKGLYCIGEELINKKDIFDIDTTKLVINFKELATTGYEVQRILYRDYKIKVEMADICNVIIILTAADTQEKIDYLISALKEISNNKSKNRKKIMDKDTYSDLINNFLKLYKLPPQRISPREAVFSKKEILPLKDSVGRVSAESIVISPPGIPLIWPGEELTHEVVELIELYRQWQNIQTSIKVVKE